MFVMESMMIIKIGSKERLRCLVHLHSMLMAGVLFAPSTAFCERLLTDLPMVEDFDTNQYEDDIVSLTGGSTHEWISNGGWDGSGAAKFHPPMTTDGRSGLGQFTHINGNAGTEQLNVRFLVYHGTEWGRVNTNNKVVIMNRSDNMARPMIGEVTVDDGPRTYSVCDNTVCIYENGQTYPDGTESFNIREEEWVSLELEANTRTGVMRLYITTQDGEHSGVYLEQTISEGPIGAGTELFHYIDIIGGWFNAPTSYDDNTYYMIDELVIDDSYIGPPKDFVDGNTPDDPPSNPIDLSENSYVSLNPRMSDAAVVSLADNNVITAGDRTLQLDLYQHGSLYNANEDVISPGMVITGTAPFDLGSGVSGTDTPVHASMLGREFVMPHSRGNHTYHMISPQGNANVQITLEGTTSVFTLTQGEPFNLETGEVNGNVGAIITSDAPILVSHTALVSWGEADASPIPPAARELWGVCSGHAHVSAAEDNTLVRIYSSTGSTKSVTLNAGEKRSICPSLPESERNQGRGPALHIVAENSVGAVQIGDGDGGDQTAFYPTSLLNSRFGIPKSSQYVAITCPADASITLYQPNGTTDTRDCNADGNHPGKVLFGDPATSGAHIAEGSYLESTSPVYVIYEVTDSNDEHNLIGVSAYVTPIFSTGMEGGASDWMYPRTVQGGGGATITFPSVNNNPVAQFNCRAGSSNEVWLSHYFGDHEFSREEPVDELWLNLEYRISSTSIYSPNAGSASKILYFNWSSPTDRTRTSQVVLSAIDSGSGHSFRLSKEVFNVDGSWRPGGELWDDPTADLIPVNEKLYLQLHVRNSTNGAANGIVQLYNNGELVFERRNVVLNEYGHSPNVFDLTPQVSATPPGSAGNGYVQYDNVSLYTNNPGPFTAP
jgi:hypothetical protein